MYGSWVGLLDPANPWQRAYPAVAELVKGYLTANNVQDMGTLQLVEVLYPQIEVRGLDGAAARKRLERALRALAAHELSDCVTRKPARKKGSTQLNLRWHAPEPEQSLEVSVMRDGLNALLAVLDVCEEAWRHPCIADMTKMRLALEKAREFFPSAN